MLAFTGVKLVDCTTSASISGYGFSDVYWYTSFDSTASWPAGALAYRFQAVDLPRYSVADTIDIWALGSVSVSSVNNEKTTAFELGNAQILAVTFTATLFSAALF